eukprot:127223-Alexandrium_andersonii.AAC.1
MGLRARRWCCGGCGRESAWSCSAGSWRSSARACREPATSSTTPWWTGRPRSSTRRWRSSGADIPTGSWEDACVLHVVLCSVVFRGK